jgi:hypothetical protein
MSLQSKKIKVTIELINPMLGTVPKDPEVYKNYIESKKPEEIQEEEYKTVESAEERGWTGFHKDNQGYFIYDYMIKGFVKNAGNILKNQLEVKNFKSKIQNFLFINPRKIYFAKPSEEFEVFERPLRAMTAQGPRVTLARSEATKSGLKISFEIEILKNSEVTEKKVKQLFEYGERVGLGQFRNGTYGNFKVVKWKVG